MPLKNVFRPDRQLNRNRVTFQPIVHHLQNVVKVRAHNVHFVDIRPFAARDICQPDAIQFQTEALRRLLRRTR